MIFLVFRRRGLCAREASRAAVPRNPGSAKRNRYAARRGSGGSGFIRRIRITFRPRCVTKCAYLFDRIYRRPMFVYPPRPRNEQPKPERGPRQRALTGWRRSVARHINHREHDDVCPQTPAPDFVQRTGCTQIEGDANSVNRELDDVGTGDGIPQPPPEFRAVRAGPERKIRSMHHEIEKPVTHDEYREHPCSAFVATKQVTYSADHTAPDDRHQQAVGERLVSEIEGTGSHQTGEDPHVLDAEQKEDWPQLVAELRRKSERAQRRARRCALGCEG